MRTLKKLVDDRSQRVFDARNLLGVADKALAQLMQTQKRADALLSDADSVVASAPSAPPQAVKGSSPPPLDRKALAAVLNQALAGLDDLHRETPALVAAARARLGDPQRTSGGAPTSLDSPAAILKAVNQLLKIVALLVERRKRTQAKLR